MLYLLSYIYVNFTAWLNFTEINQSEDITP